MHPVLFEIWGRDFHTYGMAFALSILLGVILTTRRAKREGLDEQTMLNALLFAIIGVVVMSKVTHIAVTWDWYMRDPHRFLNLRVGHVFYGGYFGAVLFPFVYARFIAKIPYVPMVDTATPYMGLGLALHRAFGCMSAGCCHGSPTDVPWAVEFPPGAPAFEEFGSLAVHPTQYYEAMLGLVIFVALVYWRGNRRKVYGELLVLQVALYAVGRFIIEFFRGDSARGLWGPLSTSQWISIAMLVAAGVGVLFVARARKRQSAAAAAT
ncbi:MAG: prolipoprotein diacylglyceryl transferase [Candidatus Lernaella stagnicola]|nr:prolipoprotein diacylglyceryl transferase [Candidatus Lernaella stagnicola]